VVRGCDVMPGEEPVLAADGDSLQGPLRRVVVDVEGVRSANLILGEMERIPAFGPQILSAAQAARYIPGYGWTDAQYLACPFR
jgi:hypothetical protein